MPRLTKGAERREQIVEALKVVMAERGYENASIQRIAKQAELTSGLIHYHFGSKLEILAELVKSLSAGLEERLRRMGGSAGPSLDALIDAWLALEGEGAEAQGKPFDPGAVACWVLIGAEAVRQPAIAELYRESIARSTLFLRQALVKELALEGRVADGVPAFAAGLMATIEGYFQLAATCPDEIPPGSAAATVRAMARGWVLSQVRVAAPTEERTDQS